MKKTILFLAMIISGIAAFGQRTAADDLFDKYAGKDGYTTVYISKGLFRMVSQLDPEDQEAQALLNGLESIRILASEDNGTGINFFKEIEGKLPKGKYEELMVIRDGEEHVKFLVNQEGDIIRELLLIAGGEGDNALIIIRGNLSLKSIARLAGSLDIDADGFEYLEELENM
ncbi:MAG: DUF4252 domain-containing protein [Chlorobi bacterium]|nr:DUF4252 domain-containing protein [Chlorobiota bacterium]